METLPEGVLDNQKEVGTFNFRFHISQSLTLGEIGEVLKFKMNVSEGMRGLGDSGGGV